MNAEACCARMRWASKILPDETVRSSKAIRHLHQGVLFTYSLLVRMWTSRCGNGISIPCFWNSS